MPAIRSVQCDENGIVIIDKDFESGQVNTKTLTPTDIPQDKVTPEDAKAWVNNEWVPNTFNKNPVYEKEFVPATADELSQYPEGSFNEDGEEIKYEYKDGAAGGYRLKRDDKNELIVIGLEPDYQVEVHIFSLDPFEATIYTANIGEKIPDNWWEVEK